jgi:hypothetical protein
MKREILDHAACILTREPTRTLSARALHERTTAELRVDFGYTHFLEALASRTDRFTIVVDRLPFRDGAVIPGADHLAALLQHAGVLRCATVTLADPPPPLEHRSASSDEIAAALAATLADAHAGVVSLLAVERGDPTTSTGAEGVMELEELRAWCLKLR